MRFAYADPPYVGCADRYEERCEVNHDLLIQHLLDDYPDGWALSASAPSLQYLLDLLAGKRLFTHDGSIRIMPWVKPFAVFKPNVNPAYAWEPVIVTGGRPRTREQPTIRDWYHHNITLKKGLVGAKPLGFCHWILDVLNYELGDSLDDLFPGTGVMGIAVAQKRMLQQQLIDFRAEGEARVTPLRQEVLAW